MKKNFVINPGAVEEIVLNGWNAGEMIIQAGKNSAISIFDQGPTHEPRWVHGSDPDLKVKVTAEYGAKISWYGFCENNVSLQIDLLGKKAGVTVNELVVGDNVRSESKRTVLINHLAPETQSAFLGFALLQNNAKHYWNISTTIENRAKKSVASQRISNLLLGKGGVVKNHPALIIRNNDVICTHSVTTGHLDEEQLFYLQARGLTREQSKVFLAQAFAEPILKMWPKSANKLLFN